MKDRRKVKGYIWHKKRGKASLYFAQLKAEISFNQKKINKYKLLIQKNTGLIKKRKSRIRKLNARIRYCKKQLKKGVSK